VSVSLLEAGLSVLQDARNDSLPEAGLLVSQDARNMFLVDDRLSVSQNLHQEQVPGGGPGGRCCGTQRLLW